MLKIPLEPLNQMDFLSVNTTLELRLMAQASA